MRQLADTYLVLRSPNEVLALRLPARALVITAALSLLIVVLIAASLVTGEFGMRVSDVVATLRGDSLSTAMDNVVWSFRFPRTLVALLTGGMMAISGAALQIVTRNGLADPSLVGISQGAALVVVGAIILFPGLDYALRPWLAFGGALAVAGLVQGLSVTRRRANAIRFILLGIGMSAFITAITQALLTYGDIEQAMSALAWMAGSVNAASWQDAQLLALWGACLLPILLSLSRVMSVLRMGDETAIGLGAQVKWARLGLIAIAVGFAAAATAIVGPLSFVGLIAPHAARRLVRAGVGLHLVITGLCGAALVLIADLIGRGLFAPVQIPAGLVTAIIGVPAFVYLLQRSAAHTQM